MASLHTSQPPSALEQGKAGRPEGTPQAQGHLGNPGPATATR